MLRMTVYARLITIVTATSVLALSGCISGSVSPQSGCPDSEEVRTAAARFLQVSGRFDTSCVQRLTGLPFVVPGVSGYGPPVSRINVRQSPSIQFEFPPAHGNPSFLITAHRSTGTFVAGADSIDLGSGVIVSFGSSGDGLAAGWTYSGIDYSLFLDDIDSQRYRSIAIEAAKSTVAEAHSN
jgi:hypothetical protein